MLLKIQTQVWGHFSSNLNSKIIKKVMIIETYNFDCEQTKLKSLIILIREMVKIGYTFFENKFLFK